MPFFQSKAFLLPPRSQLITLVVNWRPRKFPRFDQIQVVNGQPWMSIYNHHFCRTWETNCMELAMDTPVSIRTCCAKYTWMSIDNPWLSIDNLRSDFEHSEGGNVHTSRDVTMARGWTKEVSFERGHLPLGFCSTPVTSHAAGGSITPCSTIPPNTRSCYKLVPFLQLLDPSPPDLWYMIHTT